MEPNFICKRDVGRSEENIPQNNHAGLYQQVTKLTRGEQTIQEFYANMWSSWSEMMMMEPNYPAEAISS